MTLLTRYRTERAYHDQVRQAEILEMALKPRPKLKGIPLGSSHRVDAKAGKVVPIKKKLAPPAEYVRAKRQKWKAAK